jgi:hypothetical protein
MKSEGRRVEKRGGELAREGKESEVKSVRRMQQQWSCARRRQRTARHSVDKEQPPDWSGSSAVKM